jgi:hypothetical protein
MFLSNQLSLDTMKGIIIPILGYSIKHHVLIHFGLHYLNNNSWLERWNETVLPLLWYFENAEWIIIYIF